MKLTGKKPEDQRKKEKEIKKREKKKANGVFFANQILQAPACCENCGKPLAGTKSINPRAIVAHILAKRDKDKGGFPSVALHPLNRWFACGDCHTDYDNKGEDYVLKMPVLDLLKQRVAAFFFEMPEDERRRVPAYLNPNYIKKDEQGRKNKTPGRKSR